MIEKFRRYMRSRSLRRGVDIYSAMKAWGSPFPVEVVIFNKPYFNAIGWCQEYNADRKNIYFNLSTEIFTRFKKNKATATFPSFNESYSFSDRELWKSLNKQKISIGDYPYYVYAHECAHKFLSIHHINFACHCLAFGIVDAVLLIRLGLDMEDVFAFYNFYEERQACYSFRKYGAEATLRALKLIVSEAANKINDSYVNTVDCCEKAVKYDCISDSQNLIIKWAAYYKKQIIKERFERWVLIVLCLLLFSFWLRQL